MELLAAEELVGRVNKGVAERAHTAISTLLSQYGIVALIVERSPFDRLPDSLAAVLASRSLTNAADGMLYREALVDAGSALGIDAVRYERKLDATQMAADQLGVAPERVTAWVIEQKTRVGAPWQKDHRVAAVAALSALRRYAAFDI